MRVAGLHIYPIKGCRGVALEQAMLGPRGLAGDRRWLIVDTAGRGLTQREHPVLATIVPVPTADGLRLELPDGTGCAVPEPQADAPLRAVTVWSSTTPARVAEAPASARLSEVIGQPVTLVYMPADNPRVSNPAWAGPDVSMSFGDGYPVLVATTGSLDKLNATLVATGQPPVPMARFRPNIVIESTTAWAESTWARLAVGAERLDLVKPCDRCLVTTIDQVSGRRTGKEPLATLARLRRSADARVQGVLFGENAVARTTGLLRLGDSVEVLEHRPAWPVAADGIAA